MLKFLGEFFGVGGAFSVIFITIFGVNGLYRYIHDRRDGKTISQEQVIDALANKAITEEAGTIASINAKMEAMARDFNRRQQELKMELQRQQHLLTRYESRIDKQGKIIESQSAKIAEQDAAIKELRELDAIHRLEKTLLANYAAELRERIDPRPAYPDGLGRFFKTKE